MSDFNAGKQAAADLVMTSAMAMAMCGIGDKTLDPTYGKSRQWKAGFEYGLKFKANAAAARTNGRIKAGSIRPAA